MSAGMICDCGRYDVPEYPHLQAVAGRGRGPGSTIYPTDPMVANPPIRLRRGVFVVACGLSDSGWCYCWSLALTCSQYKVSGCSVTSPDVVNVISWGMFASAVIAVDMLRRASAVSLGRPALSSLMDDVVRWEIPKVCSGITGCSLVGSRMRRCPS